MGAKPGGTRPPNIFARGDANAFVPPTLHGTRSIFCQQVQFFYFLTWGGWGNPQIVWLHLPNNLEILLVNAFCPPLQLLHAQSQSSVIKFSSFIFLPREASDSKTWGGNASPPTFSPGGH